MLIRLTKHLTIPRSRHPGPAPVAVLSHLTPISLTHGTRTKDTRRSGSDGPGGVGPPPHGETACGCTYARAPPPPPPPTRGAAGTGHAVPPPVSLRAKLRPPVGRGRARPSRRRGRRRAEGGHLGVELAHHVLQLLVVDRLLLDESLRQLVE